VAQQENRRLNSWKEIADYLGRDVRTVVRWEQERGLPVRRAQAGARQSVFASAEELDAWLRSGKQHDVSADEQAVPGAGEQPAAAAEIPNAVVPRRLSGAVRVVITAAAFTAFHVLFAYFGQMRRTTEAVARPEVRIPMRSDVIRFERRDVPLAATQRVVGLVLRDLNADGILDLIVSDYQDGALQTFLGEYEGTYRFHRSYGGCPGASLLDVVDLSGQGAVHIAVSSIGGDFVALFRDNRDGSLTRSKAIPVPGEPRKILHGDFDRDGLQDLAVATIQLPGIVLILNRGGAFTTSRILNADEVGLPAAGDFNEDGFLDLAVHVLQNGRRLIRILRGRGDGTFEQGSITAAKEEKPSLWLPTLLAADFDRDGHLDLASLGDNGVLMILHGAGNGEFPSSDRLTVPTGAIQIVSADLNGDGYLDLVLASSERGSLIILPGLPAGSFAPPVEIPIGGYPMQIRVADLNADGRADIAVPLTWEHKVVLLVQEPGLGH